MLHHTLTIILSHYSSASVFCKLGNESSSSCLIFNPCTNLKSSRDRQNFHLAKFLDGSVLFGILLMLLLTSLQLMTAVPDRHSTTVEMLRQQGPLCCWFFLLVQLYLDLLTSNVLGSRLLQVDTVANHTLSAPFGPSVLGFWFPFWVQLSAWVIRTYVLQPFWNLGFILLVWFNLSKGKSWSGFYLQLSREVTYVVFGSNRQQQMQKLENVRCCVKMFGYCSVQIAPDTIVYTARLAGGAKCSKNAIHLSEKKHGSNFSDMQFFYNGPVL